MEILGSSYFDEEDGLFHCIKGKTEEVKMIDLIFEPMTNAISYIREGINIYYLIISSFHVSKDQI